MKKKNLLKRSLLTTAILVMLANFMFIAKPQTQSNSLLDIQKVAYAADDEIELPPDIEVPFSFIKWLEDLLKGDSEQ